MLDSNYMAGGVTFLALSLLSALSVAGWIARPGTTLRVIVAVALCWACAALVPVLLPLDIASAGTDGTSSVPPSAFPKTPLASLTVTLL